MKKYLQSICILFLFFINNKIAAQSTNVNGPAGSGTFGSSVTVLSNGNYVVIDAGYDDGATLNVGAVYLYDGTTHTQISMLKGSSTNDLSSAGAIDLGNGNYIIISSYWDNGAAADAGAVTFANGTTGISGVISAANSLVGSTANDQVGLLYSKVLGNGNYLITSFGWDNGAATNAGAVTFGNGTTGVTGLISAANSLIGTTANDQIGSTITMLSNGNYLITSSSWNGVGAITFGTATTGVVGAVSASNSFVGSATNHVGYPVVLNNGNYVIVSAGWDNGATVDVGAVTWCSGTTGKTGTANSSNSLTGSTANDVVGYPGVLPLTNGNYVVMSQRWSSSLSLYDIGAVTWCNGTTGRTGAVSTANSLVGAANNDEVGNGYGVALTNGNYVVCSFSWNNGAIVDAGAATLCDGTAVRTGTISAANSLVGSKASDLVGQGSGVALTNGNYVIKSYSWDNGAVVNAGAITFGNGSTGVTGIVSTANSLVGATVNEQFGNSVITPLSNGNYVVGNQYYDNGGTDVGSVTWCSGTTGRSGTISSSTSLIGTVTNDRVYDVVTLSNGNYIVKSSGWDNGATADAGAVTWCSGTTGRTGAVSSSNSLVGTTANDFVGSSVTVLSNGNYVARSSNWDNGAATDAGAITWCSGTAGRTGSINSSNSLIGSTASDNIGTITALSDGNYIALSSNWDNGATTNSGAITFCNGSSPVSGFITTCNSVTGTAVSGGSSLNARYNPVYNYFIAGRPADNMITIYDPVGMALANSLDVTTTNINGLNSVPLITTGACRIIATVTPFGGSAISGTVNPKIWIEPSVPTHAGKPFVARHYEITPTTNAPGATGWVTLYFTQQEFDDFNAHPASDFDLPINSSDATGKSHLRIGKYSGTSSGSGLPSSYNGSATVIDPVDTDIEWNATLSRWEVSFYVAGFSGFIVQTSANVLPLSMLEFTGRLLNNNAVLNWKTDNEQNADKFFVERSTDGRTYTSIGTVDAMNKPGINNYNFIDPAINALAARVVYYRLQQKDIDNRSVYTRIVALSVENKNMALLYPNPVADKINVTITINRQEKIEARIIDNMGRAIKQWQWNAAAGSSTMAVDMNEAAKGIYYLELKGETINERKQFVKQ